MKKLISAILSLSVSVAFLGVQTFAKTRIIEVNQLNDEAQPFVNVKEEVKQKEENEPSSRSAEKETEVDSADEKPAEEVTLGEGIEPEKATDNLSPEELQELQKFFSTIFSQQTQSELEDKELANILSSQTPASQNEEPAIALAKLTKIAKVAHILDKTSFWISALLFLLVASGVACHSVSPIVLAKVAGGFLLGGLTAFVTNIATSYLGAKVIGWLYN